MRRKFGWNRSDPVKFPYVSSSFGINLIGCHGNWLTLFTFSLFFFEMTMIPCCVWSSRTRGRRSVPFWWRPQWSWMNWWRRSARLLMSPSLTGRPAGWPDRWVACDGRGRGWTPVMAPPQNRWEEFDFSSVADKKNTEMKLLLRKQEEVYMFQSLTSLCSLSSAVCVCVFNNRLLLVNQRLSQGLSPHNEWMNEFILCHIGQVSRSCFCPDE